VSNAPGPCPQCRSANTRRTTTKPPRKHEGRTIPCTTECEQPSRFCLNCRLVTPVSRDS
jgi:hypothetical protein